MAALPALFGLLLAALVSGQTVDIEPRESVKRVGDDVTVLCRVGYAIDSCRMTVGAVSYRLIPSNQDGDVVYAGKGLESGECGAHIRSIKEEWNGLVVCVLPPQTGNIEVTGNMSLIVARPPGPPQLITPEQAIFREGDRFQAQCTVPAGRPAAKITWMLNDQVLVVGLHEPVVTTVPGSDLKTISQNMTRTLLADDSNMNLVCKADHEAMDQPRMAARQLQVHYPPKRLESGTITIFGLKLGAEGRLNVTVRANPTPFVEWTVGDQRLTPSRSTDDGSIMALEPIALGNGYYNCSLLLLRVAKEDVDRTYYLRVYNDLGNEEFAVRLSTMDEPAGVELDTGAIVGIVVAVLVLLIAVFLIVFAKATDRWCFGGRSHRTDIPDGVDSEAPLPPHDADGKGSENPTHEHGDYIINGVSRRRDHTKNSGESDTESAVGGKAERSRLAELSARVRAVLPRSKDKVQATDNTGSNEAEEKAQSEDKKKDVVYAELALGEGARDKPPPHATEYAQIVYTTPENAPTTQPDEAKDKE